MSEFRDRKGQPNTFTYDASGHLIQDLNAGGGGWLLERTELENGYQTAMTTAEGRQLARRFR